MGFMHLEIKMKEKFKLKTKPIETKFKYQFYTSYKESFQLQNTILFSNPSTASRDTTSCAWDLFLFALNKDTKKRLNDCLVMIDFRLII